MENKKESYSIVTKALYDVRYEVEASSYEEAFEIFSKHNPRTFFTSGLGYMEQENILEWDIGLHSDFDGYAEEEEVCMYRESEPAWRVMQQAKELNVLPVGFEP